VLTQLNVWIDVIFTTLWSAMLIGLALHMVGNFAFGRARRRFFNGEWPHHEGGPVPVLPKVLHFQHVSAMILLAISGLYIRFPSLIPWLSGEYARWTMRWIHYVAMVVVIINLIVRLWYAFASKRRDYKEFVITSRDITTAPMVIAYYLFLIPPEKKPHLGKYNVMQKTTYITFVPLLIVQAITGLALLTYTIPFTEGITAFGHLGITPRDLFVGWWLGPMVGSTDLAGWYARTVHYLINWLFIVLTTVHVYLALSEDFPAFRDFFGLGGGHHEEGHGAHAHGDGHVSGPEAGSGGSGSDEGHDTIQAEPALGMGSEHA
jgi:Ni/Fe-hydrogenase b-type cytochrome subunit